MYYEHFNAINTSYICVHFNYGSQDLQSFADFQFVFINILSLNYFKHYLINFYRSSN